MEEMEEKDEVVKCNKDFSEDDGDYTSLTDELAIGQNEDWASRSIPSFLLILRDGKKVFRGIMIIC